MLYENANEKDIVKIVSERPTIVQVYSEWCSPCKMLKAQLIELGKEDQSINVALLDIETNQDYATEHKVVGTPTMHMYRDGQKINEFVGYIPPEELLEMLKG